MKKCLIFPTSKRMIYNVLVYIWEKSEGICMSLALILVVSVLFLAAIFTAGYNDKPVKK
jgi:hypothetical protein